MGPLDANSVRTGDAAMKRAYLPRWVTRSRRALRLVAMATETRGKERYDLLVEAARIVVALREPRPTRGTFNILAFRRSTLLLEHAIGKLGDCAGCLVMGTPAAKPRWVAQVRRVVNAGDPIGLLRSGAPGDEYTPEIHELACRLPECRTRAQTHAVVHRVFVKWFGARIAGPRRSYAKLAAALHAIRPRAREEVVP